MIFDIIVNLVNVKLYLVLEVNGIGERNWKVLYILNLLK